MIQYIQVDSQADTTMQKVDNNIYQLLALTEEIKFPVVPRMQCFGNDSTVLTSTAKLRRRDQNLVVSASVKSRLLKKDALGYITQWESKFFNGLLLAYGMLCLECQNAFSILL